MICKHAKASQQRPTGLLHPFEILQKCWQDFFCDFITDLSELKDMNIIFIVVNKLLKKQHYILCCIENKWMSSKETVWLFIYEVFCYHSLPQSIVSNQGFQFISRMWKSLLKQLNINSLISISHHLEIDSQTEHFNQKVKTGLYLYMNHLQNNWIHWLSVVEFADNNAVNKFIKMTSFYLNKNFSLCMFFSFNITKAVTVQKKL